MGSTHAPSALDGFALAQAADGRADGAGRHELVGGVRLQHAEALANEDAEDGVHVAGDALRGDGALEELGEQTGLSDERVPVVGAPLEQPERPVLATVLRERHLAGGVLGRDPQELVLAADVVVQPGDRHVETLGHRLEGEPVEPDLVRGLCDHLPTDARRPTQTRAVVIHERGPSSHARTVPLGTTRGGERLARQRLVWDSRQGIGNGSGGHGGGLIRWTYAACSHHRSAKSIPPRRCSRAPQRSNVISTGGGLP